MASVTHDLEAAKPLEFTNAKDWGSKYEGEFVPLTTTVNNFRTKIDRLESPQIGDFVGFNESIKARTALLFRYIQAASVEMATVKASLDPRLIFWGKVAFVGSWVGKTVVENVPFDECEEEGSLKHWILRGIAIVGALGGAAWGLVTYLNDKRDEQRELLAAVVDDTKYTRLKRLNKRMEDIVRQLQAWHGADHIEYNTFRTELKKLDWYILQVPATYHLDAKRMYLHLLIAISKIETVAGNAQITHNLGQIIAERQAELRRGSLQSRRTAVDDMMGSLDIDRGMPSQHITYYSHCPMNPSLGPQPARSRPPAIDTGAGALALPPPRTFDPPRGPHHRRLFSRTPPPRLRRLQEEPASPLLQQPSQPPIKPGEEMLQEDRIMRGTSRRYTPPNPFA
ncbi:MAG: hypothetical protein MRY21_03915 [Simkaniaceae bacterium]|nr:hypothetical protein [Simkaniaceae bacterium]